MGIFNRKMRNAINPLIQPGPMPSPCIGVCEMDARSGLCRGCARSIGEIAEWGTADEARKRVILATIQQRFAQAALGSTHTDN